MANILAFDFGLRRIGVAVGQTITATATALPHIHAKDGIPNWDEIHKLIFKWQPEKIIVGLPLTMEDETQYLTHCARKFGNRLRDKFKLPLEMADERLTTKDARSEIVKTQGQKGLKKGYIDSFAAKILLEDWFLTHSLD